MRVVWLEVALEGGTRILVGREVCKKCFKRVLSDGFQHSRLRTRVTGSAILFVNERRLFKAKSYLVFLID